MLGLGPAQLDLEKQVITVGARRVALQRKPYLVLLYLVENRHRMVSRQELLDRFWDGREVYDQSLSKAVGSVRKALGDAGGEEFIETRWGIGYRYVGPFVEVAPLPRAASADPGHPLTDGTAQANGNGNLAGGVPLAEGLNHKKLHFPPLPEWALAGRPFMPALLTTLVVGGVVLAAMLFFHRSRSEVNAKVDPVATPSVAVLPFTAESDNVQGQYLGLELADQVTARLDRTPDLSVRSSSTVRSIVGLEANPATAAKNLRVQALVTGKMQRRGNQTIALVQLVNGETGATLWSASLLADAANLPAAEYAIAQHVSAVLTPQSEGKAFKSPSGPGTASAAAYSDYMQAQFIATSRTRVALSKAIALLNDATRLDPKYARAYAALADCYTLEGFYGFAPSAEAYPRGKQAALKALSLNNSLVEAHVSLLSILADYDWDWKGAEREFQAAIAIDPNYAVAYQYYGYALMGMGRGQEALGALKQAAQIDPVSPSIQASVGWGYYLLRQNQAAVDQCRRVLNLHPGFVPAHQLMGIVYGQMNDSQLAMNELNRAQALEPDDAITPVLIDYELARMGRRSAAALELRKAVAKPDRASLPDYYVAAAWAEIGDHEKADAILERAFQVRSNWVTFLPYDSRFDGMRADPRFQAMLRQIDPPKAKAHSPRG